MERLTPRDAAFLNLEDQVSAMHSLTVGVFDGPEVDFDSIVERMSARVPLVPRFRQRVIDVPLKIDRPVWVDDPEFDIEYHMRHTGLPVRADDRSLENLLGRLLTQRLDRGKPLWELWIVSGLPSKRWAVVSKAHYSMIDGVSGTDPLSLIVDQTPSREREDRWDPAPVPGEGTLLAQASLSLVFDPAEQARLVRRTLAPMRRIALRSLGRNGDDNPLTRTTGPHRQWYTTSVDFEDVRRRRDRLDVSTNDVVLGITTAGFRALIEHTGRPVPPTIRALVPMAVATGNRFTNEVSAMEAELPVAEENLDEMIRAICRQTLGPENRSTAVEGRTLADLKGLSAPTLSALGLRSATRASERLGEIETVIVNSPGPSHDITLFDRPMHTLIPAVPLVAKVRISVGVMSYGGQFHFGISADRTSELDVAAMIDGIDAAADQLV